MITVEIDDRAVVAKLDGLPEKLRQTLLKKTQYLALKLEQKVKENLYNKVLRFITGELYGSIFSQATSNATSVEGMVASSASSKAAPYARIQEYGGTTRAHVIEAVNAKALLIPFSAGGNTFAGFYKKVNHPGSNIPASRYMGSAFDEMKPEIVETYEKAPGEAWNE